MPVVKSGSLVKSCIVSLALLAAGSALAQPVSSYQNLQNKQADGGDAASPASSAQSGGNAELYAMIQQLQETVSQLNGKVEEQQHKLQEMQSQAKSRYIDLDQRIQDLNRKLAAVTSAATASGNAAPNATSAASASASGQGGNGKGQYASPTPEEQKAYNAIHDLIQAKHYDKAIDQLYQFLSKYPKGDLTVNAYYWLGEVYLAQGQLQQAEQAFTIVSTRYSDHRKAPDAMYNLGLIDEKQNKNQDATQTLRQVISTYPDSHAAELAKKELDKLKAGKK